MPTYHCNDPAARASFKLSVPKIPSIGQLQVPSGGFGSSNIRGAIVLGHGWNDNPMNQTAIDPTFITGLVTDGWIVYTWPYPDDAFYLAGTTATPLASDGVALDMINDGTDGARYLATCLEEWDHIKWWLHNAMPQLHGSSTPLPTLPIAYFGVSWGGWHGGQVALNRYADLVAWGIHIPVTVISDLSVLITAPYAWGAQPAYNSGTTYTATQLVTFSGNVYYSIGTTVGNAPSGTTANNTWWDFVQVSNAAFGPINTTGADITTLQGIGNGSGGVLPFSVVGWSSPDIVAQSELIAPYATTASSGYYAGLMTLNGPLTEGHTFSGTADTPFYTGFFTGSLATTYSAGTTYLTNQMVTDNGFMYSSIAGSTGNAPTGSATSNAFWTYFSTPPWTSTFCVDHLCPKAF